MNVSRRDRWRHVVRLDGEHAGRLPDRPSGRTEGGGVGRGRHPTRNRNQPLTLTESPGLPCAQRAGSASATKSMRS